MSFNLAYPKPRTLFLALFLLLFPTPTLAEEKESFFKSLKMSAADIDQLDTALAAAARSLAPYREKALPEGESIPAAVPAFFAKATELTGKYDLSAGDLLLVPQSLMVRSGRVAPKEAERAFQPLKDLLDKHRVSGGEVLDLIVPGILTKTELLLKTPPEKRKELRGSSPDTSKRRQVVSFAQKHNIPLLEMAAALKSLRSL